MVTNGRGGPVPAANRVNSRSLQVPVLEAVVVLTDVAVIKLPVALSRFQGDSNPQGHSISPALASLAGRPGFILLVLLPPWSRWPLPVASAQCISQARARSGNPLSTVTWTT